VVTILACHYTKIMLASSNFFQCNIGIILDSTANSLA